MIPHWFYDYAAGAIVVCSVLHTFLPPWEFLAEFPTAQKYYKLFVYVVGYVAGNARSTVYRSISVGNPSGVNAPGKNGGSDAAQQAK